MSQSLAGLRRDQTTLLVWQQRGSRLFNKAGSKVCETRDICILCSRFRGQLHLFSLFLPFNQSEDALWPARPIGLAGQLDKCQKPNWERLCHSLIPTLRWPSNLSNSFLRYSRGLESCNHKSPAQSLLPFLGS